ncbi:11793_t:CDS:10, partial [Acaulospora morrowiae]
MAEAKLLSPKHDIKTENKKFKGFFKNSKTSFPGEDNREEMLTDYVDPLIGTQNEGHVFPGPCHPYGVVKVGFDTDNLKDNQAGYTVDGNITGITHLHASGTGGEPKYGVISQFPITTFSPSHLTSYSRESFPLKLNYRIYKSPRSFEHFEVGYMRFGLKRYNVTVELTASRRAALHRYTFPIENDGKKVDAHVILDLSHILTQGGSSRYLGGTIYSLTPTQITGVGLYAGGWNEGIEYKVYFCSQFDQKASKYSTWWNGMVSSNVTFVNSYNAPYDRVPTGALMSFNLENSSCKSDETENCGSNEELVVKSRVGISFISAKQACLNAQEEIPNWDFEKTKKHAVDAWERELKKIKVKGEVRNNLKKIFYSGIYRTMIMPSDRTGENPKWTSYDSEGNIVPNYDDFYTLWDTFRQLYTQSSIPLFTLFQQHRVIDIAKSLIDIYQHEGYMPDGRSGMSNGITQGGSNCDMVISEIYLKNLSSFSYNNQPSPINWTVAYDALLKDAEVDPFYRGLFEGRMYLSDYKRFRYIPTPDNYEIRYAYVPCSRTLEYATNDWSIALVAKGMNRTEDYRKYGERARNWENLWCANKEVDGIRGFILPRFKNGSFDTSWNVFNIKGYTPYYEGSAWEYSLDVMHDVRQLVNLSGGPLAFEDRLDKTFHSARYPLNNKTLSMKNAYLTLLYNIGNEPDFFHPCLYHFIGKQHKSVRLIRDILEMRFGVGPGDIPGNDDSGAMGSWFAFHAIGIYPVAGQDIYLINSPHFNSTIIDLSVTGSTFQILAHNLTSTNMYIQRARLNGIEWRKTWFRHRDISNGGILELWMGEKASESWGIIPESENSEMWFWDNSNVNVEDRVIPPSLSDLIYT